MNSLFQFLRAIDLPLDQIYLDPNNPRFTQSDWSYIPEDKWSDEEVQEAAQRRLLADFEVDKLRMNMEVNGYLPIDRVIVSEFQENKYVVLEGNRRICAAKLVGPLAVDGSMVSAAVQESVKIIPCLLYTGTDSKASWIFQGLRHISGISEWSAFNKAKLLVEQMEKEEISLTEVGRRFGLTAHGAGQWVRGYNAFSQARMSSDYINEVDEKAYPYFQELFGRSSAAVREWLEWDEDKYEFNNKLNLDEFISWLYPRPDADQAGGPSKKGDFERRRIARRDDIRQIAELIKSDKDLFEQFRGGAQLENCYSLALSRKFEEESKKNQDVLHDLFDALSVCEAALRNVPFRAMKDADTREKIINELVKIERLISDLKE